MSLRGVRQDRGWRAVADEGDAAFALRIELRLAVRFAKDLDLDDRILFEAFDQNEVRRREQS
jgi:hypothetical protein